MNNEALQQEIQSLYEQKEYYEELLEGINLRLDEIETELMIADCGFSKGQLVSVTNNDSFSTIEGTINYIYTNDFYVGQYGISITTPNGEAVYMVINELTQIKAKDE